MSSLTGWVVAILDPHEAGEQVERAADDFLKAVLELDQFCCFTL